MGVKVRERPKGSGEWWIFIDYQGKRKSKKIGRDKRLALEVAKRIEARLILGVEQFFSEGDGPQKQEKFVPTLKEYVYGWEDTDGRFVMGWIRKYALNYVKRSTRRNYEVILQKHLLPSLGDRRLDRITTRSLSENAKFACFRYDKYLIFHWPKFGIASSRTGS